MGDSGLFYTLDLENKNKTVRVVLLLSSKAGSFQYNQVICNDVVM